LINVTVLVLHYMVTYARVAHGYEELFGFVDG
jgi:hypothetical protein